MLIRLLLPVPFSRCTAWTSPSKTSRSMLSLARTPGNRFVMPRRLKSGSRSRTPLDVPEDVGLLRISVSLVIRATPRQRAALLLRTSGRAGSASDPATHGDQPRLLHELFVYAYACTLPVRYRSPTPPQTLLRLLAPGRWRKTLR